VENIEIKETTLKLENQHKDEKNEKVRKNKNDYRDNLKQEL
jgi:hypothetical protein